MKLQESDNRLSKISRSVEGMLGKVDVLSSSSFAVELLETFEHVNGSSTSPKQAESPASYSTKRQRILINAKKFLNMSDRIQQITLIHEIAHAYLWLVNDKLRNDSRFITVDEEHIADYLVCAWGYENQLEEERLESYGPAYCEALRCWKDEKLYVDKMEVEYNKRRIP